MRRLLRALPLVALLLAGSIVPTFAHGSARGRPDHQGHGPARVMCVRGVSGACNPGLPGWHSDPSKRWRCYPVMGAAPPRQARSHAWMCAPPAR